MGHSVVGIEAVAIPIKEFFSENNLQYTVEDIEHIPGQLYKVGSFYCNTFLPGIIFSCVYLCNHYISNCCKCCNNFMSNSSKLSNTTSYNSVKQYTYNIYIYIYI